MRIEERVAIPGTLAGFSSGHRRDERRQPLYSFFWREGYIAARDGRQTLYGFEADNLRAQVREESGAVRARPDDCHIQNSNAFERQSCHAAHLPSLYDALSSKRGNVCVRISERAQHLIRVLP